MDKYKNKSKHFTLFEKKVFLDILKRYKHIVEVKKSDSTTLKDKDVAWLEICNEYNASQLVTQERNVQQLKKFWANLKQNQRDALTKEKQSQIATGGGPPIKSMEIDPDVSVIAPNLMKTAPTIYSSNLNDEELKERETQIVDYVADGNLSNVEITLLGDVDDPEINYDDMLDNSSKCGEILNKENIVPNMYKKKQMHTEKSPLQSSETFAIDITPSTNDLLEAESKRTQQSREKLTLLKHGKRAISSNDNNNEISMKTLRVQKLLEQEMELNTLKIEHEKKMFSLKEQHVIQMQKYELRAVVATAEIAELQLQLQIKKMNN